MAKKRSAQKGGESQRRGGSSSSGALGMSAEDASGGARRRGNSGDAEMESDMETQSVFDLLKQDHRNVEELFDQIEAADEQAARSLIEQVCNELLVHMRAEEETVYSRLRDEEDFSEQILKADEEHAIVHGMCRELLQVRQVDERILAKAKVMKELVEHHVEEEENELIPTAEELIGQEAAMALGEEFTARKLTLQGEGERDRLGSADVSRSMEMGEPSR